MDHFGSVNKVNAAGAHEGPGNMHAADRYAQETSRTPRDEVAPSGRLSDAASVSPPSPAPLVLDLPADALVVLIGSAGTGKSTWAARHFEPDQVGSSDQ